MQSLKLATKAILLAYFFSVCSGCFMPSEKCQPYINDLIRLPTKERIAKFHTYNLETQYNIYICGMQEIEPPIDLAGALALEGKNAVELLKIKLSHPQNDETISDIIRVLSEITIVDTYDVREDKALTKLVSDSFAKIKDDYWRRVTEKHVNYIMNRGSDLRPRESGELY